MESKRSFYDVIQKKEGGRIGRPQCRACGVITRPCLNKYCSARPKPFKSANGKEDGGKTPRKD